MTFCIGYTEESRQEREGLCVRHLLVKSKAQATARVDAVGTKKLEEWRVGERKCRITLHGMVSAVRDEQYKGAIEEALLFYIPPCLYCFNSSFRSFHKPSIYLSIDSHCVFPIEIKYRICVCHIPISTFPNLITRINNLQDPKQPYFSQSPLQ